MSKEKNTLIAKFMEYQYYSFIDFDYNFLVLTLEKIESLGYKWEIGMSSTLPYHYCKIWSIGTIEGIFLLDAIYGAIIEFIKWYNNK